LLGRSRGTRVALSRLVRVLSILAALPTLPACLVPFATQVDPPDNFPASIADPLAPPTDYRPIGSHIDLSDIEPGDAGVSADLFFEVAVRDPDINQPLEWQVWVNYTGGSSGTATRGTLLADPQTDPDRRTRRLSFGLSRASLIGCNRIELQVSSEFSFADQREPVLEGDVAMATWWVVADRTVPISSCAEAP
jgi:hypothetical protein